MLISSGCLLITIPIRQHGKVTTDFNGTTRIISYKYLKLGRVCEGGQKTTPNRYKHIADAEAKRHVTGGRTRSVIDTWLTADTDTPATRTREGQGGLATATHTHRRCW